MIHFETADSAERTQIGEGIVKSAVAAGRLETGGDGGKHFRQHDDGCAVDGDRTDPAIRSSSIRRPATFPANDTVASAATTSSALEPPFGAAGEGKSIRSGIAQV